MRDLGSMTVDRLKKTITRFNESFGSHLRLNGLKNDLVRDFPLSLFGALRLIMTSCPSQYTRIRDELSRIWTYERHKFPLAKSIISQVRQGFALFPFLT